MKYKSELIHEILEQRGHEKSSLHYQSECVESWVDETKGAYPKLCDYESEWLNYINENPIGEFPYETVSTNSMTTVNNVVPFAYKSAILKGHTLVNLSTFKNNSVTQSGSSGYITISDITQIKPSTDYTFVYYVTFSNITSVGNYIQSVDYLDSYFPNLRLTETQANGSYILKFKQTSKDDISNSKRLGLKFVSLSGTATIEKAIIIEGDYTNIDIPYFESMQSVKMPVLTTAGKNLFDGIIEHGGINSNTGLDTTWSSNFRTSFMRVPKNNTNFLFTFNYKGLQMSGGYLIIIYYNENKERILTQNVGNKQAFNFNQDAYYYRITQNIGDNIDILDITNIQLEEGTVATSYEPFKSNILTVNESIELRGIGDVQDTLDCLTGEVVKNTKEVVLNGSEEWAENGYGSMKYFCQKYTDGKSQSLKVLSDKIPTDSKATTLALMNLTTTGKIQLITNFSTVNELQEWLSQNPITVQYELATPVIKTVGLTVVNQDGEPLSKIKPIEGTMHVEVSGTSINPTAVLEVPVEAVTQNLNSFIEEE